MLLTCINSCLGKDDVFTYYAHFCLHKHAWKCPSISIKTSCCVQTSHAVLLPQTHELMSQSLQKCQVSSLQTHEEMSWHLIKNTTNYAHFLWQTSVETSRRLLKNFQFCCYKRGCKRSWSFFLNIEQFHTCACWHTFLNSGHWLVSRLTSILSTFQQEKSAGIHVMWAWYEI